MASNFIPISVKRRKPLKVHLPDGLKNNPIFRFPDKIKCFCGSNRKFKKCCKPKMPLYVTDKEAADLEKALKEAGI